MTQNSGQTVDENLSKYSHAWYDMMSKIWTDRIKALGLVDTQEMMRSVDGKSITINGLSSEFIFQHIVYSIYVDMGVGNGYTEKNGGDLDILRPSYREEHKLNIPRLASTKVENRKSSGKPRKRTFWLTMSWSISRRLLVKKMAEFTGEKFVAMFDNLDDIRSKK